MSYVFISGSSKLNLERINGLKNKYYRNDIPLQVKKEIDKEINNKSIFLIGDCCGVDSMVQNYLYNKNYKNVEIFSTGNNVRNNADKFGILGWKINNVDGSNYKKGSKEWHAVKDTAMILKADRGIAVVLGDNKSKATRHNIGYLYYLRKKVFVYEVNKNEKDNIMYLSERYDNRLGSKKKEGGHMRFFSQLKKTNKKAEKAFDVTADSVKKIRNFAIVSMSVAIATNVINMFVGLTILNKIK